MRLLILFFLTLFLLFSCKQQPVEGLASFQVVDSMLVHAKMKIEKKRGLDRQRQKLYGSRLGKSIKKYKPIIKKYAKHYGLDWRLIVAQIVQESGFKEKARSRVGARGLMQLMPLTAKEISTELDIKYIMKNPRENITAGIYHLQKQLRYFPDSSPDERTRLALASYNAGPGRVFDAQSISRFYKLNQSKWVNVRPYLSKLKKSDWELHLEVWPNGKPRYGFFYGSEETTQYVDKIWKAYSIYKEIL